MSKEQKFLDAVKNGDSVQLNALLEEECVKSLAFNHLVQVVKAEDEEMATFLVQNGISPIADQATGYCWSPLHLACIKGLLNFVKAIPDIGHHVHSLAQLRDIRHTEVTPFHCAMYAYSQGHRQVKRWRTRRHALKHVEPPDPKLTSLLVYLVENGADANSGLMTLFETELCCPEEDITALHLATATPCNLTLAIVLLEHGAKIDIVDWGELCFFSPYINALAQQHPSGAFQDYLELIKLLHKAGADPEFLNVLMPGDENYNNKENRYDIPPERRVCLQILLNFPYECSLNKLGENGKDFLPRLATGYRENYEMVALVFDKEPKLKSLLNVPGCSGNKMPLIWAAEYCNLETAVEFMKYGALPNTVWRNYHYTICTDLVDMALKSYVLEGGLYNGYTEPFYALAELPAQKQSPNLESFIIEACNRGLLSEQFLTVSRRSSKVNNLSFKWTALNSLETVIKRLTEIQNNGLNTYANNPYFRGIWQFVYLLCHNDLLLPLNHEEATQCVNALESLKTDIDFICVLHNALKELEGGVVELRRLCCQYLRVYLSTEHGRNRQPFDLRVICRQLPLDPATQEYIMIQPN